MTTVWNLSNHRSWTHPPICMIGNPVSDAAGRFCDGDPSKPNLGRELWNECATDEFNHVLSGGIRVDKGLGGIQISIPEWSHDSIHHGLESMKITQKTVLIENRALDEYREVPIVTVNLFTCAGEHQSMCGGEGCLD